MYDFDQQIKEQEEYYTALMDWLKAQTNIAEIQQATEEEDRHKGIDLWVVTTDNRRISLQVKIDFWSDKTGNLIFELISQAYPDRAVLGWSFTTSADYLLFLVALTGDVYIFKTHEYVEWVLNHYATLQNFSAANRGYKTLGCKVPLKDVVSVCFGRGNIDDRNAMEIY